jgi:hypothetical protein
VRFRILDFAAALWAVLSPGAVEAVGNMFRIVVVKIAEDGA